MARYAMVIDLNRCIGCTSCAVACKMHNAIPPGLWWRRVDSFGTELHPIASGEYPNKLHILYLTIACMHCDNPPCVNVCPVGASFKREDGLVLIDYERCIGCRYCMTACPYGARQFNWQDKDSAFKMGYEAIKPHNVPEKGTNVAVFQERKFTKKDVKNYQYGYPFEHRTKDGKLVYTPERPEGVVEKCSFCVQYVDKGEQPACVRACPGNAIIFGDLDDPESLVSRTLRATNAVKLLDDLGTKPRVFYILPSRRKARGVAAYEKHLRSSKKY